MPRPTITVCAHPGCPTLTNATRCPDHQAAEHRRHDRRRGTRTQRGYDNDWLRLRDHVVNHHIATHGYTCPGWQRPPHFAHPTTNPLTGDHVVELHEGGQRLDPSNVAVLCRSCNTAKSRSRRQKGGG